MITEPDLCWMAAVFDLKARYQQKNNASRKTPQLVLQVGSKDPAIINRLCDLTGIKPDRRPRKLDYMQRACSAHCPEPHVHHQANWKVPSISNWAITGAAAAIVLYNVRTHLTKPDNPDINHFINYLQDTPFTGQGSHKIRETVQKLQALGWDMPPIVLQNMPASELEGGLAKTSKLSCGHERVARLTRPGSKIWCEPCHGYKLVTRRPK